MRFQIYLNISTNGIVDETKIKQIAQRLNTALATIELDEYTADGYIQIAEINDVEVYANQPLAEY